MSVYEECFAGGDAGAPPRGHAAQLTGQLQRGHPQRGGDTRTKGTRSLFSPSEANFTSEHSIPVYLY